MGVALVTEDDSAGADDARGADSRPPLADLADRVRDQPDRSASGDVADPFDRESFEALGPAGLWDAIESTGPDTPADREPIETTGDTAVVPKRDYCERCGYFSAPPDSRCTNDGTTIIEFVDRTRLRVAGCPFVGAGGPE